MIVKASRGGVRSMKKATFLILTFILVTVMLCGCQAKHSSHNLNKKCIECGGVASHYMGIGAQGVKRYYCDSCYANKDIKKFDNSRYNDDTDAWWE